MVLTDQQILFLFALFIVVKLVGSGFIVGYLTRQRKAKLDSKRLVDFYENLLRAELIQQHIYLDIPAIIYLASAGDKLVYIGQTTQTLEKRISQHAKGTTSFDRIYGREPEQWQWQVLEIVPCTYRYAAERAWIKFYKEQNYRLLNVSEGTVDGLEWEVPII